MATRASAELVVAAYVANLPFAAVTLKLHIGLWLRRRGTTRKNKQEGSTYDVLVVFGAAAVRPVYLVLAVFADGTVGAGAHVAGGDEAGGGEEQDGIEEAHGGR
ncbi:hypothetical protein PG984_013145 [Apiospora sp. TS-2023a]